MQKDTLQDIIKDFKESVLELKKKKAQIFKNFRERQETKKISSLKKQIKSFDD